MWTAVGFLNRKPVDIYYYIFILKKQPFHGQRCQHRSIRMKQFFTCEWAVYWTAEMNASKSSMYEAVSNGCINHCQPLSERVWTRGCRAEIPRKSVISTGSVLVHTKIVTLYTSDKLYTGWFFLWSVQMSRKHKNARK